MGVDVGVLDGVYVLVGVFVGVYVCVTVDVGVFVSVGIGVFVLTGVYVGMGVHVGVFVSVGVLVGFWLNPTVVNDSRTHITKTLRSELNILHLPELNVLISLIFLYNEELLFLETPMCQNFLWKPL